ncbi:MAG: hypothetical protein LBD87_01950 [Prevotellaceae bacterium]|jgi:hypothetical protein|nr:hypothetical protein [Prevotellaceae bacterium]
MTTSKDWMNHNHDELYRQAVQTQTYLGARVYRYALAVLRAKGRGGA